MVVPTLGQRNDLLKLTLESLARQTEQPFDIVMIFPLKNKETAALAKEYNARMIDDPGGLSAAVNAGIAQAQPYHEYIGWIGDDDLVAPRSIKTTVDALDKNPDAVVAFGYCDYINDKGDYVFTSRAGRFAPWIMTWGPNLVPMPGLMLRKDALTKAGTFDEDNKYSMDLDMLLRLRKIGKFVNTGKTLASFRWHPSSTTVANRKLVLAETEKVKRKYLPSYLKPIAPVWELPVRIATKVAAKRVNNMAAHK